MRSLGIPTELVISSESKGFRSEKMNYKCYLGNLICNEFADGRIAIPNVSWVKNNIRQVYRANGTFAADVGGADCLFNGRGVPEDKSKAVEIWKSILEEVTETKNNIKHKVCHTLYECYNNWLEVAKDEEKAN